MMEVTLLIPRVTFNNGGTFSFIVCHTVDDIKVRTNMQVDTLILILFCYLFGVDSMRVITMVIDKLIVFNCSIYA